MTLKYISHKYLSLQKTSAEETTRDYISDNRSNYEITHKGLAYLL